MIHIRRAGRLDSGPIAALINEIIVLGGTTSMTTPLSRADIIAFMQEHPGQSAWFLAEGGEGQMLGVQWIEPNPSLPPEAADIATFTRPGHTQMGIGSSLFRQTRLAASAMGYEWINATIRADNPGGLAFYQSRGFEDYKIAQNIRLGDGSRVDKISKRYEL